jgi:SAM-dependent methyltransferase
MIDVVDTAVRSLPAPFREERFTRLRTGIHDDQDASVYVNEARDFAFLHPQPRLDYTRYEPRYHQLGLAAYRKRNEVIERRFRKIAPHFEGAPSVLEIGALDAAFLRHARERKPGVRIASLEVDDNSKPERDRVAGLEQFADFSALRATGRRFDVVCFFHVLEHVLEPAIFLDECRAVLAPGGRLLMEVPSLDDPLLALYAVPEYEAFYFQRQHPYVYSARSLRRALETYRLRVTQCVPHQRYGLENHLTWLAKRQPGGNDALRTMFAPADDAYRAQLEAAGLADAVIVAAEEGR